jgi:outer membrane murein-binding lipoprotein Lpp
MDADPPKPNACSSQATRKADMQKTRIPLLAIALAGAGLSLSGCATEDYVDKHIAVVSQRIDGLEARVAQVETAATQANQAAQAAMGSAQQANQRLDQLTPRVDSIEQRLASKRPRG